MKNRHSSACFLQGTLMVGGCGQKAADPAADTTAQVTEASDSAPADKPDGAREKNSDRLRNPPDGTLGNMDGEQAPPDGEGGPGGLADRIPHRNPTMLSPAFLKIKRKRPDLRFHRKG